MKQLFLCAHKQVLTELRLRFSFVENLLTILAYKVRTPSGKEQSAIIIVDGFQDGR